MSIAESAYTYRIQRLQILWSSYRKLAWVGFEPATTEPLFKHSTWLSYEAMCSTLTQSQLSTTTSISWFLQCHIWLWLFVLISRNVSLIEVFCR